MQRLKKCLGRWCYRGARVALILGVACLAVAGMAIVIRSFPLSLIALALAGYAAKRRYVPLTACGSARFITREELKAAKMLGCVGEGINVGKLVELHK